MATFSTATRNHVRREKAGSRLSGPKLSQPEGRHMYHALTVHSKLSDGRIKVAISQMRGGKTPSSIHEISRALKAGSKGIPDGSPHKGLHDAVSSKVDRHVNKDATD